MQPAATDSNVRLPVMMEVTDSVVSKPHSQLLLQDTMTGDEA